jgi:hypothetical protein
MTLVPAQKFLATAPKVPSSDEIYVQSNPITQYEEEGAGLMDPKRAY